MRLELEKLHLSNYRGFESLDLRFPQSGPAVLIGINGAGKSSVLDSIALVLAHHAALLGAREPRIPFEIPERDIRRTATTAYVAATFAVDGVAGSLVEDVRPASDPARSLPQRDHYAQSIRARLARAGKESINLPVLCYYRPNRGIGPEDHDGRARRKGTKSASKVISPQLRAYEHAFSHNVGPFQGFVRWFRLEEDRENEVRLRKDPNHRNARLEGVRRAVLRFMNALGSHTFDNLRMERALTEDNLDLSSSLEASLLVDKSRQSLSIDQLSDGEKGTLLLVADLAMRLAIANPERDDPLSGTGIVLIDELELHLHPGWQRAMLPGLTSTFPGCQFVVTTHSPLVLSQVQRESVFILDDFRIVEETPPTYGRDASSILEDLMGLSRYSEQAARRIHRIGELIDQEDLDAARGELSELARWFGDHDAEIVRLRALIDFMAR
jgi:predicted ATP-binding protein involved in virulence